METNSSRSKTGTDQRTRARTRRPWGLMILLAAGAAGCAVAPEGGIGGDASPIAAAGRQVGDLTEADAASLQQMREEEKLARDVYLTLGEQFDHVTFERIAESESRHMNAVLGLLNRYGLADPAAGREVGEFSDPELQSLYDELTSRGARSLADALRVGGLIEELDISDLRTAMADTVQEDIEWVYGNLLRGSGNHLRAFVGALRAIGQDYEPTYLGPDELADILDER